MTVGFLVDGTFFYEIGSADFLHSFFSTISYHLEPDGWGTKYPYLLKKLYYEPLEWSEIALARNEAKAIKNNLKKLTSEEVVWDINDLTAKSPWGKDISEKVPNLANYFATSEGDTFFDILNEALNSAEEDKSSIVIHYLL
ncbi:MAG: immunity 70 family protein [Bacillota bacterium]|nr:immunity 70 family protein [Bacillota bacterium]